MMPSLLWAIYSIHQRHAECIWTAIPNPTLSQLALHLHLESFILIIILRSRRPRNRHTIHIQRGLWRNIKRRMNLPGNNRSLRLLLIWILSHWNRHTCVVRGGGNLSVPEIRTLAKDGSGPFYPQSVGESTNRLFDAWRISVENDDFADSRFSEVFFCDGEFRKGCKECALNRVGGKGAVRKRFEPSTNSHKDESVEKKFV